MLPVGVRLLRVWRRWTGARVCAAPAVVLPAGVGREALGADGFAFPVCGRDEEDALAAPLRGAAFGGMVLWCDVVVVW